MLRKILSVLLIGTMVCGLVGCGITKEKEKDVADTEQNITSEIEKTSEETEKQEETTYDEKTEEQQETTSIDKGQEETTPNDNETGGDSSNKYEIVPADSIYVTADGERLTSGDVMPLKPTIGDKFITLYYEYEYGCLEEELYSEYMEGWNVKVESSYAEYGAILSCINGAPVLFMINTFDHCYDMESAPEIPESVKVMVQTFNHCEKLKEVPQIPEGVIDLSSAFISCKALEKTPIIPNGVKYMDGTFINCKSLITAPEIPDSVTSMNCTFYDCESLTTVAQIPSSVENMDYTFAGCFSLTGEIVFDADPTSYEGCFSEVDFVGQNFTISGKTSLIKELRESRKIQRPQTFI